MTYSMEVFGPALRRLRKSRGLRQEEVAEEMGISRTGPSRYEQPGTNLRLSNLVSYLNAIDATLEELDQELAGDTEALNEVLEEQIRLSEQRIRDEPGYRRLAKDLLERFGGPEKQPALRAMADLIDEQDQRIRKLEEREASESDESPANGSDGGPVDG